MVTVQEIEQQLSDNGSRVDRHIIERALFECMQGTPDNIDEDSVVSAPTAMMLMVLAWIRGYSRAMEVSQEAWKRFNH